MSITICDTHLARTVRYLSLTFEPVYLERVQFQIYDLLKSLVNFCQNVCSSTFFSCTFFSGISIESVLITNKTKLILVILSHLYHLKALWYLTLIVLFHYRRLSYHLHFFTFIECDYFNNSIISSSLFDNDLEINSKLIPFVSIA